MTFQLTKKFVLLCEGQADQIFFEKLFERRKIKNIDIPPHVELGKYYGWAGLGRMLKALSGDPQGYARLKGVLIVADSGTTITSTFKNICRKLKEDGPFGTPSTFVKPQGPYRITEQQDSHPPISIMLIPDGRPGALETLCVESIFSRKAWLKICVENYLACGQIDALNWRAEKRDKAYMQCIIAALYEKDPNKGLRYLFSVKPPIINFSSKCFTPLIKQIERFCDEAENI